MTHFEVWSLGLVFSGDLGTKKYFSICNTLHLNRFNDSHSCINLILILHTPSLSLHFFPENCLQVVYFSSCPKSYKSEIYQTKEFWELRRPCRKSGALSVCFYLNKDVLSLIWVSMWTWNNKLSIQRFRGLSFLGQ